MQTKGVLAIAILQGPGGEGALSAEEDTPVGLKYLPGFLASKGTHCP